MRGKHAPSNSRCTARVWRNRAWSRPSTRHSRRSYAMSCVVVRECVVSRGSEARPHINTSTYSPPFHWHHPPPPTRPQSWGPCPPQPPAPPRATHPPTQLHPWWRGQRKAAPPASSPTGLSTRTCTRAWIVMYSHGRWRDGDEQHVVFVSNGPCKSHALPPSPPSAARSPQLNPSTRGSSQNSTPPPSFHFSSPEAEEPDGP